MKLLEKFKEFDYFTVFIKKIRYLIFLLLRHTNQIMMKIRNLNLFKSLAILGYSLYLMIIVFEGKNFLSRFLVDNMKFIKELCISIYSVEDIKRKQRRLA